MAGLALDDFQDGPSLTVEDFKDQPTVGPNLNDRTVSQLAATDTILVAGTEDDYRQTKEELLDPEARQNFLLKHQKIRDAIWEQAQGSLIDLLADPTVSDSDKIKGVTASKITVSELPPYSTMDTLAEEAAVADSGEDEDERSAESRFNALDTIRGVNKQKRELTAMVNSLELGKDASFADKALDIGELMLPFAEWIHFSQLQADILDPDDDKKFLLGNQKKAIYDKIQSMSVQERGLVAEQLMAIVQENENIVLPDGNDISNIETLHRMLINNDYSNLERYVDNITSILDITGIGLALTNTLRKATKATKAPTSGPRAGPRKPEGGLDGDILDAEGPSPSSAKGGIEDEPFDLSPSDYTDTTGSSLTVQERRALTYNTQTEVVPTSPSQVVKDVNPDIARKMNEIVADDPTEEAAKALYGTNKTEAMANDLLPVPETPGRGMPNKVEMRPSTPEPEQIKNVRLRDGNTILSDEEFARVGKNIDTDLRSIEGMTLHPSSMVSRVNKDGTIGFTARYSFVDAGFRSVDEALQNAEFAFRKYGLTNEQGNFTLLSRQGDQWLPVTQKDIEAKAALREAGADTPALRADTEFAIGIDYNYRFSAEDIPEVDLLTTAPGYIARTIQLADSLPRQFWADKGQGSLVQNLLDAASVIHPQILNAASVAVDRTYGLKKLYVQEFEDFSKAYAKFKPERRALVTDYIHQANLEGIKFDKADLLNRGFTNKEIAALKQWRKANDIMWYAANDDMAKTLRGRGYVMFVDHHTDTKLAGRPIAEKSHDLQEYVYDVATDTATKIPKDELSKIYKAEGTIIRLARPIEVNGKFVDLVLSRNSPHGGFTRRIYDGETVLAYRDGYYPVSYEANFFIDKVVKGADGKEIRVAVAAARDTKEAEQALRLLRAQNPKDVYDLPRPDRSLKQPGSHLFDEGHWSLSSSAGLTTQRFRGERLRDAGEQMQQIGTAHLKDPLEAVAKQIHQLSQRVSMRTYMDTAKARWLQNYGQYLELPVNKLTGQLEMPSKPSQVIGKRGAPTKMVTDARSNYNYLYSLENGYINGIDNIYKSVMHSLANFMADQGFSLGERALLKGSTYNPAQLLKTQAFKLFLSASPVRQALIQRGQILLLGAVNPKYVSTGLVKDLVQLRGAIVNKALGLEHKTPPKVRALLKEVEDSGILEAVDAHNLIRDEELRLANVSNTQKIGGVLAWPLRQLQKIGFDFAEQDNLLAAWLTFRDKALKEGVDVSMQRAKDKILGNTRAYTLNMNRAGEQPYSHNTAGLFMQFMSFRHKVFLQTITNRSLSPLDRAKLMAYSAVLFGPEATIMYGIYDKMMEKTPPSELKDTIRHGLLDFTFNGILTMMSGEKQDIDFSDFAPSEAAGMYDLFKGMLTTDIGELLANSPATSLYFGNNARVTNMAKTMMRYFVAGDYDDPELQTRFSDVVIASMSVFSGLSAGFKANYAFKTGQKLSSYGRISDADVTKIEAAAAVAGFRTRTETGYQDVKKLIYGEKSFTTDDVENWYLTVKRHIAVRGKTVAEIEQFNAIAGEAWRVFGDDRPAAVQVILDLMAKDFQNQDYIMWSSLLARSGYLSEADMQAAINKLPAGPVRDSITATIQDIEKVRNHGN